MVAAVATKESVLVDEWIGCYRGGWKGVIVDEAFSHPAKVAFNLAKRIYEHAIDYGWIHPDDVVIDPFGGIGGCAFHGLMNGMRVVTCELEEKFVNLSKRNRELWRKQYTGLPGFNADSWIILQGDSRKLASVICEAGLSVSSPPYASGEKGHPSLGSVNKDDWGNDGRDITRRRGLTGEYGSTVGNVAQMPEGDHALCVSSPPFPQPYTGGGGINVKGYGDGSDKVGQRTYQSQGGDRVEGNLETLANEGFQAAISSPPYEGIRQDGAGIAQEGGFGAYTDEPSDYWHTQRDQTNIGNLKTGDTFWSASRVILEQLYSVLSPGAHAIFIVKAFVRDKKIVDFPTQWAQVCEAVGFKLIHDHHALLTEHSGTQGGMFGEDKEHKVKRISFFRRLHEKKSPETAIEYENVLCFERQ